MKTCLGKKNAVGAGGGGGGEWYTPIGSATDEPYTYTFEDLFVY